MMKNDHGKQRISTLAKQIFRFCLFFTDISFLIDDVPNSWNRWDQITILSDIPIVGQLIYVFNVCISNLTIPTSILKVRSRYWYIQETLQ